MAVYSSLTLGILSFRYLPIGLQTSKDTNSYDKYGQKTGYFKKDSSGRITEYDKYGRKVGSYK